MNYIAGWSSLVARWAHNPKDEGSNPSPATKFIFCLTKSLLCDILTSMKLSRLEILGFKSFPLKTNFDFNSGIVAIVGPNGCGKTNILEAIEWVLGEQNPFRLRGEKMEDFIFKGSQSHKPLNFAEVTAVIENDETLPISYQEVAITRRYYRSGESEYFINRTNVRRKDIVNLFLPGIDLHHYDHRSAPDYLHIALFIVIYLSWYLNVAFIAMEHGIRAFWTIPFKELFMVAEESRYQLPSVMARAVNRYAELASLALYIFLVAGSFIVLLRRKIAENYRKYAITAFVWLFGVAIVIALNYGGEGSYRLYLFCLLPSACIIALLISKKLLLIPVMCLMVALFPFSNHSVDAAYRQVRTTELKGSEFFAMNIQPWHSYYYGGDPALVNYYQPTFYEDDAIAMFAPSWLPAKMPGDVDLSYIDTHCQYVLISRDGTDHVEFGWGVDPYTEWPEKSEVGRRSDRLYDNGDFQIYWNSFEHLWNPPVTTGVWNKWIAYLFP